MNRLILIGNGFDLAHGSSTGYNDFIKWYLTQALRTASQNRTYEDELLYVEKNNLGDAIYFNLHNHTEAELVEFFYHRGFQDLINNTGFNTGGWQNTWQIGRASCREGECQYV